MRPLSLSIAVLLLGGLAPLTASLAEDKKPPEQITGVKTITAQEAKDLFDKGVVFVDVRKDQSFAAGRIPDAFHIELQQAYTKKTLSKVINKDQDVVIYCEGVSCLSSAKAAEQAVGWGYQNVYYFRDGFTAWKESGYPVE